MPYLEKPKYKRFRKDLFESPRKTCPKCKRRLKYKDPKELDFSLHELARNLTLAFKVRIYRKHIKRVALCNNHYMNNEYHVEFQ